MLNLPNLTVFPLMHVLQQILLKLACDVQYISNEQLAITGYCLHFSNGNKLMVSFDGGTNCDNIILPENEADTFAYLYTDNAQLIMSNRRNEIMIHADGQEFVGYAHTELIMQWAEWLAANLFDGQRVNAPRKIRFY